MNATLSEVFILYHRSTHTAVKIASGVMYIRSKVLLTLSIDLGARTKSSLIRNGSFSDGKSEKPYVVDLA